jgi:hypothetical protein
MRGPTCIETNPVNVNDGTSCKAASPTPGSLGLTRFRAALSSAEAYLSHEYDSGKAVLSHAYSSAEDSVSAEYSAAKSKVRRVYDSASRHARAEYEGARCIVLAAYLGIENSGDAILEETGYQLKSLLDGLIPGLMQMLIVLGATTVLGSVIGGIVGFFFGGVGAAPGAVVGGDIGFDIGMAALTWLGVGFLAVSIAAGFAELLTALKNGVQLAWSARYLTGKAEEREVRRASDEFASCIAILIRLILQAILAYLLKKAAMKATKGAMATARMAQSQGAAAIAEADVAELVSRLRGTRLGRGGFADWLERNWRDLRDNPKLKPKPAGNLGAGGAAGEGAGGGAADEPSPAKKGSAASDDVEEEKPDLSSNAKKGVFGEAKADAYMKQKGFKKLNGPDVQVGDAPRGQGIDGVYENMNPPPKYVIGEAKFGSSQLGKTQDGMQMSENWIDNRLEKAVGRETADDIQLEGYDRLLLKVDENGNVTPKIVNEDAAGKITLTDPPAGSSP